MKTPFITANPDGRIAAVIMSDKQAIVTQSKPGADSDPCKRLLKHAARTFRTLS